MKVFTESGAVSLQIYVGLSELSHYSINSCSATVISTNSPAIIPKIQWFIS